MVCSSKALRISARSSSADPAAVAEVGVARQVLLRHQLQQGLAGGLVQARDVEQVRLVHPHLPAGHRVHGHRLAGLGGPQRVGVQPLRDDPALGAELVDLLPVHAGEGLAPRHAEPFAVVAHVPDPVPLEPLADLLGDAQVHRVAVRQRRLPAGGRRDLGVEVEPLGPRAGVGHLVVLRDDLGGRVLGGGVDVADLAARRGAVGVLLHRLAEDLHQFGEARGAVDLEAAQQAGALGRQPLGEQVGVLGRPDAALMPGAVASNRATLSVSGKSTDSLTWLLICVRPLHARIRDDRRLRARRSAARRRPVRPAARCARGR